MPVNANPFYIQHCVRIRNGELWIDGNKRLEGSADMATFLQEMYAASQMNYLKFFKMDTLSKLGILASHFLLEHFPHNSIELYQKKIIFQNTHSSLATDRLYANTIHDIPSPALFVYTLPNIVMGEIAIRYGFKGENTFFITPEFSSTQLSQYIQTLEAEIILTGYINFDGEFADVMMCLVAPQVTDTPLNSSNLQACYSI